MVRAVAVAVTGGGEVVRDTLLLSYAERRSPGGTATGLRGTLVEIALPEEVRLQHDDHLVLDDGGVVAIVARPEAVLEMRSADSATLARMAWFLGDHHIPVEIHERYLRVLQTAGAEDLLGIFGIVARRLEAPFEPEGGAYDHVLAAGG
ncbi:MAG: urease accessory protein UreE [Pseudorhodoplanes sp.]|uniref:urease accessory protein UreE n=1 Tax=Pseudorhodoplanes sp. TaxID=1934341 RepID=UPI003D1247E3